MKINHQGLKLLILCYCFLIRITPNLRMDCELIEMYPCSWVNMNDKNGGPSTLTGCHGSPWPLLAPLKNVTKNFTRQY